MTLFPDRILAIYIRDVQVADREKIAIAASQGMAGRKVEMVIVDTTLEAAEHALKNALIIPQAIAPIVG